MLANAHRQAAQDIEASVAALSGTSGSERLTIEGAWGAAFHWIAFGCETKHGQHQESHARLATFLRGQGEATVAAWWDQLDRLRQGGWYGHGDSPVSAAAALGLLRDIGTWTTS